MKTKVSIRKIYNQVQQ